MVKMTMTLANMAIAPKNTNAKEKKRWQLHMSWLWSKWQWQWQWQKLMSMMAPYWQNGFWRLFKLPWKHFQYPWFVSQLSRFLRTKNKLGWVCCQTIIRGDNMICGDSNVYLCHCNILKEELFMKQFSLLFQPPRESFGQNRECIGFLFWWRPTPEIHLHKGELHLPPSTDRLSPHILRQDMKSCLMMEMLGNDDAVLRYLTKIHALS